MRWGRGSKYLSTLLKLHIRYLHHSIAALSNMDSTTDVKKEKLKMNNFFGRKKFDGRGPRSKNGGRGLRTEKKKCPANFIDKFITARQFCKQTLIHFYQISGWCTNTLEVLNNYESRKTEKLLRVTIWSRTLAQGALFFEDLGS